MDRGTKGLDQKSNAPCAPLESVCSLLLRVSRTARVKLRGRKADIFVHSALSTDVFSAVTCADSTRPLVGCRAE